MGTGSLIPGILRDDPAAGGLGLGGLATGGGSFIDELLLRTLGNTNTPPPGPTDVQGQFEGETFFDERIGRWVQRIIVDYTYDAQGNAVPVYDFVLLPESQQAGGGGGGVGRVQFPSEANLQQAQADQIRAQMGLLMPQFGLEERRLSLDEQREVSARLDAEFNQRIQEALLALQEGRLTLDQLRLEVESAQTDRQLALDEMLGTRGLDIQEQLGMRGLDIDEASLALQRELGFANLEEQQKDRALTSAMGAISSFLQGMSLADARRIASFQETRALIPFMVDPDQQFFSGLGPESALASAMGPGFQPTEISHMQVPDPSQLALPPTPEQINMPGQEQLGGLTDLLGGLQ